MLTEKYKNFIEDTAYRSQNFLKKTKAPNRYDYLEVKGWLVSLGAILMQGEENCTVDNTIYLDFYDGENFKIDDNSENIKKLFHEVWHFISNKLDKMQGPNTDEDVSAHRHDYYIDKSNQVIEISANYFSRAMLFPEKRFVQSVMRNLNVNGSCNIFEVAKEFNASYVDVIARGNDLNIWNTKVGRQ